MLLKFSYFIRFLPFFRLHPSFFFFFALSLIYFCFFSLSSFLYLLIDLLLSVFHLSFISLPFISPTVHHQSLPSAFLSLSPLPHLLSLFPGFLLSLFPPTNSFNLPFLPPASHLPSYTPFPPSLPSFILSLPTIQKTRWR